MKKIYTLVAFGIAGLIFAPSAHASTWVEEESAAICNTLSLVDAGYSDWNNIQISLLQLTYDVSRSEAVGGMREAAVSYCPEYVSSVPLRQFFSLAENSSNYGCAFSTNNARII